MGEDLDDLFFDDDPLEVSLWQRAAEMVGAPPKPGKQHGVYSLAYLARMLPVLRTSDRLAVALLLYRRCLMRRSRTVDLPNGELVGLGIGRKTKYRTLLLLQEAGALTIEARNGRSIRVTLHWFP
jgi:hypothetical protein